MLLPFFFTLLQFFTSTFLAPPFSPDQPIWAVFKFFVSSIIHRSQAEDHCLTFESAFRLPLLPLFAASARPFSPALQICQAHLWFFLLRSASPLSLLCCVESSHPLPPALLHFPVDILRDPIVPVFSCSALVHSWRYRAVFDLQRFSCLFSAPGLMPLNWYPSCLLLSGHLLEGFFILASWRLIYNTKPPPPFPLFLLGLFRHPPLFTVPFQHGLWTKTALRKVFSVVR